MSLYSVSNQNTGFLYPPNYEVSIRRQSHSHLHPLYTEDMWVRVRFLDVPSIWENNQIWSMNVGCNSTGVNFIR